MRKLNTEILLTAEKLTVYLMVRYSWLDRHGIPGITDWYNDGILNRLRNYQDFPKVRALFVELGELD